MQGLVKLNDLSHLRVQSTQMSSVEFSDPRNNSGESVESVASGRQFLCSAPLKTFTLPMPWLKTS